MKAILIYGAVVRTGNVLSQYYARREKTDFEELAKDCAKEIGADDLYKVKELAEYLVMTCRAAPPADNMILVCVSIPSGKTEA